MTQPLSMPKEWTSQWKLLFSSLCFWSTNRGVLPQVCRELGKAKINIIALAMMDAVEHGVLRLIVESPQEARSVLAGLNIPMTEAEVLLVPLANRPGALADVCERLGKAHVPISYMYCTTGAVGGKALAILKVPNLQRAMKVLDRQRTPSRRVAAVRPKKTSKRG